LWNSPSSRHGQSREIRSTSLTAMGLVWLYFDIKRVLNVPRKAVEDFKREFRRDLIV
jgi:hypothetical protein